MIVLNIMSAEAKRKEDEEYQLKKQIKEQMYKAQSGERIEKLTTIIFEKAKSEMKKCHFGECCLYITKKDIADVNNTYDELKEAILLVTNLLEFAGYECGEFQECSRSCVKTLGWLGYLPIRW